MFTNEHFSEVKTCPIGYDIIREEFGRKQTPFCMDARILPQSSRGFGSNEAQCKKDILRRTFGHVDSGGREDVTGNYRLIRRQARSADDR